jgi:ABC-type uncharacterized transport system substrate-binding protein
MQRREFIRLLSGAAAAWPLAARAQQPAMPVIGFLNSGASIEFDHLVAAFRKGLSESGYVEGKNVTIDYRWAENRYERLPALAADLVSRGVTAIAATGGTIAVQAAKKATSTIPIVFATGDDPVRAGLVNSLNRPGGNLTGIGHLLEALDVKLLEILHEILPEAATIAILVNPNRPTVAVQLQSLRTAARVKGLKLIVLNAGSQTELDDTFAALAREHTRALVVASDPFFLSRREHIVGLAARYAVAAIYNLREFPAAGGLISYGTSISGAYRQVGLYMGQILKGAKPSDMPVVQPTKFELVINLKTAKALGLTVPPTLLMAADEVIE